jgi:hypothetical protein
METSVSTVIVAEEEEPYGSPEFSWRAVFAGAVVAVSVIFFLLLLGSGLGLSLISVPEATAITARNAVTLGAIYFFAAQAFGMAVGGYLAGRLMGPVLESEDEELFHSTTHGLVVWAVAVVATVTMVTISGLAVTNSAASAAALFGATNAPREPATGGSEANNYWVDMLFRAPAAASAPAAPTTTGPDGARAEAGRILTAGLTTGERLSQDDHDQLVRLVSQSTGVAPAEATPRVDGVLNRMHQQEVDAAEAARKAAELVSLWLAASLIFGALVAAGAAVSGRWVDDKARGQNP